MGLLLSVLIGCVGVLELLACLRHATNGVPLVIEHSAPCHFYHHCDSGNFRSHDYICSFSHSSHTNFPTNVKLKLENLHGYSLRVRNDISSLDERYEGTLSDSSTKDILGISKPESKLSDDFEADMSGYIKGEETSDAGTESGFRIWDGVLIALDISSNIRISSPISFQLIDSNVKSCSLNGDLEGPSVSGSENHFVEKSKKINLFNRTDGVFQNKYEKIISKGVSRYQSITMKAKRHQDKERQKSDESMQITEELLANKYLNTTKNLSPEKKNFISLQVQTCFEENLPNGDNPHDSKDSSFDVQNERPIHLISRCNFSDKIVPIQSIDNISATKELHSMLLKLGETSNVNSAPSEISPLFDSENRNEKTTNVDMKESKSSCLNLSLNDNSDQPFDEYVDAEDEEIMILEYQVNSPIKYAVPDTGKSQPFWVIL